MVTRVATSRRRAATQGEFFFPAFARFQANCRFSRAERKSAHVLGISHCVLVRDAQLNYTRSSYFVHLDSDGNLFESEISEEYGGGSHRLARVA
jgi:hypothetical protein